MAATEELDEFGLARKRAKQQANTNLQQQQQALSRRFAILGTGPSGARIKAEERAHGAYADQLANAEESIGVAERAEARRVREIKEGREYQTSERVGSQEFSRGERLGSQEFGAGQAKLGREFSREERLGSQEWSGGQAQLGRDFQKGEREASQLYQTGERKDSQTFVNEQRTYKETFDNAQRAFAEAHASGETDKKIKAQEEMHKAEMAMKVSEMAQAQQQFLDTLNEEKRVSDANIDFNNRMLELQSKPGMLEGLFGGIGDAGTSIWEGVSDPLETIKKWFS